MWLGNKKDDDDYDSGKASNPALLTHIWEVDHPSKKKQNNNNDDYDKIK